MLRLYQFGKVNNDTVSIAEDKVEAVYTVSSAAQVYSLIVMDSGESIQVKESEQEICDAIQTWKASSKA